MHSRQRVGALCPWLHRICRPPWDLEGSTVFWGGSPPQGFPRVLRGELRREALGVRAGAPFTGAARAARRLGGGAGGTGGPLWPRPDRATPHCAGFARSFGESSTRPPFPLPVASCVVRSSALASLAFPAAAAARPS